MTDSRAAVGYDRLPWLSDEPKRRTNDGARELLGWGVAATILVASVSYWMGMNSWDPAESGAGGTQSAAPATRVPLPQARPAEPAQPLVAPAPVPQVEPVAAPPMPEVNQAPRAAEPAAVKRRVLRSAPAAGPRTAAKRPKRARRAVSKPDPHRPWPVNVVEGASGRMVRIGTFATPRQAKRGWWGVMKAYPGMKRLPARVVPVQSARDGRTYYRLQMGTTSQAHSEVLCQRMRIIGQSCVVIGLQRGGGR